MHRKQEDVDNHRGSFMGLMYLCYQSYRVALLSVGTCGSQQVFVIEWVCANVVTLIYVCGISYI